MELPVQVKSSSFLFLVYFLFVLVPGELVVGEGGKFFNEVSFFSFYYTDSNSYLFKETGHLF